jgi:demethylmenaquinone methyltransferase/2-methoxy-6-polyprenyl-1,4-benzoquinol methylase
MSRPEHDAAISAMFDRVAPHYDRLNRVLSMGNDVRWRERTAAFARLGPGEVALDVGVGTGDLAFDLLRVSDPTSRVVGVDVSEQMLTLVRERASRSPLAARLEVRHADAQALPFGDATFDRVVAGFAVRNIGDLDAGLREMRRVLKPDGRAAILEFSMPPSPFIRAGYRAYLHYVMPRVAAHLGGDVSAYRYLPRSVEAFPRAEAFAERLRAAGFGAVHVVRLFFGTVAIHVAEARRQ